LCEGHAFLARYLEPLLSPAVAADTESGIGVHKALFVDIQHLLLLLPPAICPVVLVSPKPELDQQRKDYDLYRPVNCLSHCHQPCVQSKRTATPPGGVPTAMTGRPYSMARRDDPCWYNRNSIIYVSWVQNSVSTRQCRNQDEKDHYSLLLVMSVISSCLSGKQENREQVNVVFFMVDDLGRRGYSGAQMMKVNPGNTGSKGDIPRGRMWLRLS